MAKPKLSWGYNAGIPDDATAAWGCRAIWDGWGYPDIVWDRVDAAGDETDKQKLLTHLREVVGEKPWVAVRDQARALGLSREAGEAVIYADDVVTVKANSNGSGGYLYVAAVLNQGSSA